MFEYDVYEQWLDHDKKEFTGSLSNWESPNKQTDNFIRNGIARYKSARNRCYGSDERYKSYKGLEVEFTSRQFLYWWIIQHRFFKLKKPSLGRIDHSKNYSLDNIVLQEHSENSIEARERTKSSPWKSRPINVYYKGINVAIGKSFTQIAKLIGCHENSIKRSCTDGFKVKKQWSFTFQE